MAQKRVTKLAVAAGTGIALVAPAGAAFGINADNQVNKVKMPTSLTSAVPELMFRQLIKHTRNLSVLNRKLIVPPPS